MSPPAFDFGLPAASSKAKSSSSSSYSSSFQNPNPIPHIDSCSPFNFAENQQSVLGANAGFDAPRRRSVVPGKSRPRLVKVRKQSGLQHGRSRNVLSENDSGFNPFRPLFESSGGESSTSSFYEFLDSSKPVNNGAGMSNRFDFSKDDVKFEDVRFVSGADGSGSASQSNVREGELGGSLSHMSSDDGRKITTENDVACGKFDNVSFVFGAKHMNLESNSFCEKKQTFINAGDSLSANNGKKEVESGVNVGFTFGCNQNNLDLNLSLEKAASGELQGQCLEHDGVGVVIGDNHSDSTSSLNTKKVGPCESVEKPESDYEDKVKMATDTVMGRHENRSNLEERKPSEGEVKSVDGKAGMKFGDDMFRKHSDSMPFVFGTKVTANAVKRGSGLNMDAVNEKGVFLFGSSTEKSFICNKYVDVTKNEEKTNPGYDANCTSPSVSNNNVACPSKTDPVYELPDEMKKLNIDDFGSVDGTDKMKEFITSSHKNAGTALVFKSGSAPISSNGSSTSTCDQLNNPNSKCSGPGFESTSWDNLKTSYKNDNSSGSRNVASTATRISSETSFHADLNKSSDLGQCDRDLGKDKTELNGTAAPLEFSLKYMGFQPIGSVSEAHSVGRAEKKEESSFSSTPDGKVAPSSDFKTPQWDPSCLKASLFPELNKNLEFSVRSKTVKGKRFKKKRGKLRQTSLTKQCDEDDHTVKENSDSTECYSPMDFSPYQETTVADQENLDVQPGDQKFREPNEKINGNHPEQHFFQNWHVKESVSGAETVCLSSKIEEVSSSRGVGIATEDARGSLHTNKEQRENDGMLQFCFVSGLEDKYQEKVSFSASQSAKGSASATKRWHRKKSRMKVGRSSPIITPSPDIVFNTVHDQQENLSTSHNKEEIKSEADELKACDKWRLRGNQAYNNRSFSKAEEFYTWGVNSVPSTETLVCLKPLVLCYSNRAATRVSLGKIREALVDCMMAAALDPQFLKVQMRAAKCHLLLGDVENALQYFRKCLESGPAVCLDRRLVIEASDGLEKAQKIDECMNRSAKLLEERTSDAALSALDIIAEAMSISSYSEKLLEMKAEALCLLRKYEEVIRLCEQTLSFAEKNFASVGSDNLAESMKGYESGRGSFLKLWRPYMISKSYFYLGRLEVALDILEKLEGDGSIGKKCASKNLESSHPLAVTMRELLHCKNAGNEAFQQKRFAEAVEHYTAALSSNVESRPFSAICFCNRAAAHQALGQIADAIADCSLAMALDGNYAKAVSRRATLHEMIRDHQQAACDLQRLISILKNQSDEQAKPSGTEVRSGDCIKQLKQARRQLSLMEEEAKKGIPLDLYLILGINPSDTASNIKKSYRKAALRHHPDKAGQILARSECGDDGRLWKEVAQEVQNDADRLFKMIGEAYAILSEPNKRAEYDLDEELRKSQKANYGSTCRKPSDGKSCNGRRNGQENWRTYGAYSHSRW